MTLVAATSLLTQLREQGVRLWTIDDRLCYKPVELVTPEMVQSLKIHKPELLELLADKPRHEIEHYRAMIEGLPESWRERLEERAAIVEFEAQKSRNDAELFAFIEVMKAIIARIGLDRLEPVR